MIPIRAKMGANSKFTAADKRRPRFITRRVLFFLRSRRFPVDCVSLRLAYASRTRTAIDDRHAISGLRFQNKCETRRKRFPDSRTRACILKGQKSPVSFTLLKTFVLPFLRIRVINFASFLLRLSSSFDSRSNAEFRKCSYSYYMVRYGYYAGHKISEHIVRYISDAIRNTLIVYFYTKLERKRIEVDARDSCHRTIVNDRATSFLSLLAASSSTCNRRIRICMCVRLRCI